MTKCTLIMKKIAIRIIYLFSISLLLNGCGDEDPITYKGDTFDGEMVMSVPMANMKITSKMTGRRIGNCE